MKLPTTLLVGVSGLVLPACHGGPGGCPETPITVRVDFFGDLSGSGDVTLIPEGLSAIRLEGTVTRGGAVVVKVAGSGTCDRGAVGATFKGEAVSHEGVTVDEGRLAGTLAPRPLGGQIVAAWDAQLLYKNGVRRPISGFIRDERAAPPAQPVGDQSAPTGHQKSSAP